MTEEKKNYVYIVRCSDGTYYTGWTTDIENRIRAHNEGRGAKYTRARRPVKLVRLETYASKGEALSRERAIKKLTCGQKEALIRGK